MQEPIKVDKLLLDVFEMGRGSRNVEELLERFRLAIQEQFQIDYSKVKGLHHENALSQLEEYAINTGKPYVDNRLSGYSAFPELIEYYNRGYRSSVLIPAMVEGRCSFIITLLSKLEDKFDPGFVDTLGYAVSIAGYEATVKAEKARNIGLVKYFDSAFNTSMPQLLVDASGKVVKANRSALSLFGRTQKDLEKCSITEFFNAKLETLLDPKAAMAEVSGLGPAMGNIYKIASDSVNEKLVHIVAYDFTYTKQLEERLRLTSYISGDTLFVLDKNTRILWVSGNVEKVFKTQADDFLGKRLADFLEDQLNLEALNQESSYSRSTRINLGNDRHIDVKVTLVKNPFGGFSCLLSSNWAEKYVNSIQRSIDWLIGNAGEAIVTIDSLGYIKGINRSAEKLLGYSKETIPNSSVEVLYAEPAGRDKLSMSLAIAKNNGRVDSDFVNIATKDSVTPLPCEQRISSMIDADGNLTGYMIVLKELRTKRLLSELQEDKEALEKQLKGEKAESDLKTQFIYNISHDFKTPLTNIKGFTKLLLESEFGKLTDEQMEYVKIISDESDRLMQLITQILDVAKLSSGKIRIDRQAVDLHDISNNPSLKALAEVAEKKGVAMSWVIDYNVPKIQADPNRLIQIFANLIGNAVKFTEKGSIKVNIIKRGKNVRIEVIDTGIGISKEDKAKLFRKFYQLQRKGLTRQEGSGTGLGLAIVKEIVNLHGGRINVISEPGKGSTFWFTLPIHGKQQKNKA